jgi:hypothetical protein
MLITPFGFALKCLILALNDSVETFAERLL